MPIQYMKAKPQTRETDMLKIFSALKTAPKEVYRTVDEKVVLVKEWPVKQSSVNSWGRLGYDSLYN